MKRIAFVVAVACASAGHAQTADIPEPVHDWGCEVLLCLANPAGPTAVSECVPPIHKLWRHLARGRAFPTCAMASGPNGTSFARMGHSHYDPCPPGTTELPWGTRVQLAAASGNVVPTGALNVPSTYLSASPGLTYVGIGTGDGLAPGRDGEAPPKACVAGYRGIRQTSAQDGTDGVALYDTILVAPAHTSPRVIDVYIDNRFWQRVRW